MKLFWLGLTDKCPIIYQIVRQILVIPATSAAAERDFSFLKILLGDDRLSLLPDIIDAIIFLRDNLNNGIFAEE